MSFSPQADLFVKAEPVLPPGCRYQPEIVRKDVQSDLLRELPQLPLMPFDFHGFQGKRRVISYGWKYEFDTQQLRRTQDIPPFLLPVRSIAAAFAGIAPDQLQHALVTEYAPGAPIGWHRDKNAFARIVGVSLRSACTFRASAPCRRRLMKTEP